MLDFRIAGLSLLLLLSESYKCPLEAAEPVRATLGRESAWTGEAVPLIVTLYSPGPFSGVASFDLPELPKTTILRIGNAVVGSEEVDGESMLTQRHEFNIFTQQTGTVAIPPFVVRFKGKQSFVGEAVAVEGKTNRLQFASRRPPGTSKLGIVVATPGLTVDQSWNPGERNTFEAGDVIERKITRRITNTSSMMLPPIPTEEIAGVRIYEAAPTVADKIDRGELSASRVDTIKYQFGSTGTFQLPQLTFAWWDPNTEELRQVALEGLTVDVAAHNPTNKTILDERQSAGHFRWVPWVTGLCILFATATGAKYLVAWWHKRSHTPERVIARQVRSACKSNDAKNAYTACMAWMRLHKNAPSDLEAELGEPWTQLRQFLYSGTSGVDTWRGDALGAAFAKARKPSRQESQNQATNSLPSLNP